MARTVLASVVPAGVIAVVWLRFEQPREEVWRAALLVLLALSVAAVRPRLARAAAAVVALAPAAWLAFGLSPFAAWPFHRHDRFFGPLGSRFGSGFLDFYDVHLPFDPRLHARMASIVLVAIFAFSLLVGLAVAARKPVLAALALLVGAGWPATLLGPSRAALAGTAILVGELALLAGLSVRRVPRAAVVAAAALAVAGAVVGSSPAVARHGLVAWQGWRPAGASTPAESVSFVWDARYSGIRFPAKRTTMLEIAAPETTSLYWRAAVLDDVVHGAWVAGAPRRADALEPAAAYRRANEVEQTVTVKGLADTRLVGGGAPIRFDAGGAPIAQSLPGFASLPAGLTNGFRYRVWSYAPQPSAAQLRRAAGPYPAVLSQDGLFDVAPGVRLPQFGAPDRSDRVDAVLFRHPQLSAYAPLRRQALAVAGGAATPYDATVALERWFRSTGGFTYSNDPPVGDPALVDFVTETRTGYCQYFAGAMALMLRYLGVPARVAVGFSSGTWDEKKHAWVVTDHDAHAWVEAWFRGYGWLPFDPTPSAGRPEAGVLSAGYSASSPTFGRAPRFARTVRDGAAPPFGGRALGIEGTGVNVVAGHGGAHRSDPAPKVVGVLALLLAALVALIAAAKATLRLVRRRGRGPRAAAVAVRDELAAFLLDQRLEDAAGATLHELGALVRREFRVDAEAFVAAAAVARYGPPGDAVVAARQARRELALLLGSIRRGLTRRERLRGLLSLRSLGLRRPLLDGSASLVREGSG